MVRSILKVFLFTILVATFAPKLNAKPAGDVPWISHYSGSINWETELAYLDNFAIEIMRNSEMIGYIVVYSGADSCAGEAQERAIRMTKYLIEQRGLPWNKVIWKEGGRFRGKGLEIFHLGVPRTGLANFGFPYEPPTKGQVIRRCRNDKARRAAWRNRV